MLNNKWLIAVLVGIALVTVYKRVLVPVLLANDTGLDAVILDENYYADGISETGIDTAEQGLQLDNAQHALRRVKVANLFWNESPARDPFMPYEPLRGDAMAAVQQKMTQAPQVATRKAVRGAPLVTAIVNSAAHQYAVIDGEIRRVGDRFDDYVLVAVTPRSVRLKHRLYNNSQEVMVAP